MGKRMFLLALCTLLVAAFCCFGCSNIVANNTPEEQLPVYEPGSIKMAEKDNSRKYRAVYYSVLRDELKKPAYRAAEQNPELLSVDAWYRDVYTVKNPGGEEPKEMYLKAMIEYYGIEREEYELAVEEFKAACLKYGLDLSHEYCELPNLDIIYTFDDEIINEYYRYDDSEIAEQNEPQEDDSKQSVPTYQEGSIELSEHNLPRKYRQAYYGYRTDTLLTPAFQVTRENPKLPSVEDWYNNIYSVNNPAGEEPKEMYLKALVEYYGIEKEDFEAAVEKARYQLFRNGCDLLNEDNELPNADVIYTFDDDIINHYYRYE